MRWKAPLSGLWISLLVVVVSALGATGQEGPEADAEFAADPWATLRLLEGSWTGAIDGKLGTGTAVRDYEFVLGGGYLLYRHQSVRLPQEKSPEGDQHRELAIYSYDRGRQKLVWRQFMNEGIVVRSICEIDGSTIVCETEEVEGGPGIRARMTVEIESRYRFSESYELAWPGADFELYFVNEWTRVPKLDVGG